MRQEAGFPCTLCGVRPDVSCRHRPGVGEAPPQDELVEKHKRSYDGQGYNFRTRKRT